jgi:Xaa-Pro aminopeptidase
MNNKRLVKLKGLLKERKLKSALLSSKNDIFYYTGYRASDMGFLLVGPRTKLFLSPLENFAEKLKGVDVVFMDKPGLLSKEIRKFNRVGYDEKTLSADVFHALNKGRRLKPVAGAIKRPRMVKDRKEIELMRKAGKTIKGIFKDMRIVGTEVQISNRMKSEFHNRGADRAFEPIIASGPNGYYIHSLPTKRKVTPKDLVVIDGGVRIGGYCSDKTRTYCRKPGKREKKVLEDVSSMQKGLVDKLKPGIDLKDLQKEYEDLMRSKRYKVWHGIGHGVGLSPHDFLEGKLEPGMVITIEPGVYIKGFGGCRIEDTILIKGNGREILT